MNKPNFLSEYSFNRYDIEAIQQGGCASGAFMPAVTYCKAKKFMMENGESVLDYIEGRCGGIPPVPEEDRNHWASHSVFYFSLAVEMWACSVDVDALPDDDREY